MSLNNSNSNFVKCYNCTGAKARYSCGILILGCLLCETYGDSNGNINEAYAKTSVDITSDDKIYTFNPPNYNCLLCEDTKKINTKIFVKEKYNYMCSDPCIDMPVVELSCSQCCPEENAKVQEQATAELSSQ